MSLCSLFIQLGALTFYPYLIIGLIIGIFISWVFLIIKNRKYKVMLKEMKKNERR